MDRLAENATLVIIDVQKGFDDARWGPRNNPSAERNIARLLAAWRAAGRPVIHVKHDSQVAGSTLAPGQPGNEIKDEARPLPSEPVLRKSVNSAFIGTDLEERLRRQGASEVVLCGITTNHCVSTTARMAANLGFTTVVLSDATATFDMRTPGGKTLGADLMHEVGLAELHEEFATILDTDAVIRLAG
jgi:nicotinamidase-related amidase